ncbi:MAG: NADH-quinone oxidoreductase subunit L [Longimicrobiales bacterium]
MHGFEPTLLGWIILLPLIGFLINSGVAFLAPEKKSLPTWIGPGAIGLAFLVALINFVGMLGAELHEPIIRTYWSWMPIGELQVDAALQLDQLSMLMTMIVTGVSFVIHIFSVGYMKDDAGYARYFAYLNLFVFFMLTLVLGSSFALMFVGWEGVGLCSYLLIGFWFKDREKADAGKKAFIVNRIGDFGFLVAMFLMFSHLGTLDFVGVFEAAPDAFVYGGGVVTAIALFLFLGATGKSAQIPLYVWLPDAMAGPTPVSALIHAATMVTAGVYLVARASILFALAPTAAITVAVVGAATALFAATIGLVQTDIKKVLAYSTVSQLGYMFVGVGVGAYAAGIFHLMTHAFFKALLFLGAGAVIHALHEAFHHSGQDDVDAQDMRNMGGLRRFMPKTWIFMWIATLAIAGVWPFAGFFSKDEIIWQAAARAVGPFEGWFTLVWALALVAALLTAFYMTRLMIMTFHGENRSGEGARHIHSAPAVMWIPLGVLALASIVGGWINVPAALGRTPLLGWVPHSEWLHEWMHPLVTEADHAFEVHVGELAHASPIGGGEVFWAFLSFGLAVAVILLSTRWLKRQERRPAEESPEFEGFAKVLYNKWYVDEIYDAAVVQPVIRLSRAAWRFIDDGLIDGMVNGAGVLARGLGWIGSRLQTGSLNTYAFAIAVGAILILLSVVGL